MNNNLTKELTKKYIFRTLQEEKMWKVGETDTFIYRDWECTLRKEEDIYKPFTYSISAKHSDFGTISRRYTSMELAFLHVVNNFNENGNIKNRYDKIEDFICN